jgi:chromosome segregation ATPase
MTVTPTPIPEGEQDALVAMSERTLADRLFTDRAPALFATAREAADRIAELEAEVERIAADDLRKLQLAVSQRDTLRHRIAELEASLVICRTDIEALMRSADSLEARNTELEAEVAWAAARIAELEGEVERVEEQRAE